MAQRRSIIVNAIVWGWIAFLSITGVFVTARQFVVIERQNLSIRINNEQTAHIRSIEQRIKGLEALQCKP